MVVPTALIVEGDTLAREVMARWLAESGHRVVACGSFEEAKAYLAGHTPDLLVTDIRLRDYNGLHLVMEMRDRQPAVSCLVFTDHDDPVLRGEAEHMHARYVLTPLRRAAFLAEIDNAAVAKRFSKGPRPDSRGTCQ